MINNTVKFSFIIASLGRRQQLQNCINSIEKAYRYGKGFDIEIIVVLNGAKEKASNMKTRYPELTTFYYINEKGLSRARNYGIRESKGDFLVFLDDDAQIKEDFLNALLENSLVVSAEAFCGRIYEQNTDRVFSSCFTNEKKKYLKRMDFRYFMGSSHILKRSVIHKVGFYDERFGAGAKYPGAEESDMFFRIKREGGKIIYLPGLVFYHPLLHGPKVFEYAYAAGAVLTKQIFSDRWYLFTYLFIISNSIGKSTLRILQTIFFSKSIELKNKKFRYRYVLLGTLKGMFDYIKDESIDFIPRRSSFLK